MPTERIAMRRVREMLRLSRDAGLATREVARRTGVAPSTLREMFRRFETSGLTWPLPLDLADAELEARLYGEAGTKQGHRRRAEPDWAALNRELKKKHVTLKNLWDEYIEANPDGYRYSRFCDLYRSWEARLPVTMRQTHQGGDKLFIVDYAGDTVPVLVDPRTGKTRRAHIFVAVIGGSSLSFACATWTEALPTGSTPMFRPSPTSAEQPPSCARQPQGRGDQGLLLRPAGQQDLCRDGGPLRHRRAAGATPATARQG